MHVQEAEQLWAVSLSDQLSVCLSVTVTQQSEQEPIQGGLELHRLYYYYFPEMAALVCYGVKPMCKLPQLVGGIGSSKGWQELSHRVIITLSTSLARTPCQFSARS